MCSSHTRRWNGPTGGPKVCDHDRDLLMLRDWLESLDIGQLAMESTGVFWHPIYNILESEERSIILVNAQHMKAVPGRKTDVQDSEWLADLLGHGLLKASFIPPAPLRQLRELTRYRKTLVQERASEISRLQKVLESANLKLAAVATDILGKSGRDMLDALVNGQQNPEVLAALARGRWRPKIPELQRALEGRVQAHHRFLMEQILSHIDFLDQAIAKVYEEVERCLAPFSEAVTLLQTIPCLNAIAAAIIVAEIGTDMTRFPSANHLASWVGVCSGNRQSGGKRLSGTATKGDVWLRAVLGELAVSIARSRGSYLHAQYHRIARSPGKQKAVWAVAHSIIILVYHILRTKQAYQDLGEHYFDQLEAPRLERHHVKKLEQLGYTVTLTPQVASEFTPQRGFSREPTSKECFMSQKYAQVRTIVWLVLMGIAICGIPTHKTDATAIAAQKISAATNPAPKVIPRLREWQGGTGTFHLSNASQIAVDRSYAVQLDETAAVFRNDVQSVTGRWLSIIHTRSPAPGDFFLTLDASDAGIGQEGYLFQVSDDVVIRANSNRGILYGTRTALQILLQDRSQSHLPQGKARDYPTYQERGFMLDVGRKFVPLRILEDSLKLMAWYKLNDFRLHLNDNPAFRLKSTNSAFSGLAAADGSYTKQEMRQLQDLAKQYAITITPEIDTPAHDRAITKFRPDLALSSNPNFLDLQNAKTIPFMKSLWDQFTPWFDTNQFHIGADEYDSQYADLYRQYVNTFDDYLGKKGKTVRMWGSLTKIGGSVTVHTNITIDVWNTQWQNPVNAVHQGYYVINDYDRLLYLVPKTGYYNDYLDTKTIYEKWEPTIFDLNNSKLNISYGDSHLLGGQFAEWNDNYRHVSIADIYDRVSAAMPTMGEKLWSGTTSTRTYEQFQQIAHVLGDGPGTHLPHNPPKLAWGTAFGRGG